MNSAKINLLDVPRGVLLHQVNCMGKMGKGVALDIRNKWPVVFTRYIEHLATFTHPVFALGSLQCVRVAPNLVVANVFAQYDYGYTGRYTEYGALCTALADLADHYGNERTPIYVPHRMGCMNGGGDWKVVRHIIEEYLPRATICTKPFAPRCTTRT